MSQFTALCRKQLKCMWRSKKSTVLEILIPILLAVLVCLCMKMVADMMSAFSFDFSGDDSEEYNLTSELQKQSMFKASSIVYSADGIPDSQLDDLFESMNSVFKEVNPNGRRNFKNLENQNCTALKIMSHLAVCRKRNVNASNTNYITPIAIRLDHLNVTTMELQYGLGLSSVGVKNMRMRTGFLEGPPRGYKVVGYDYVPFIIDESFRRLTNSTQIPNLIGKMFALPLYKTSFVRNMIGIASFAIPAILTISIVNIAVSYAEERQELLRYLKVMGLLPSAFVLSHFAIAFGQILLVSVLACTTISLFTYDMTRWISIEYLVVFFVLQSLALTSFSLFLGCLVRRGRNTLKLCIVFLFLMLVHIASVSSLDYVLLHYIEALDIFAVFRFLYFNANVRSDYESESITLSNMFEVYGYYFNPTDCLIALIMDSVLYFTLTLLMERNAHKLPSCNFSTPKIKKNIVTDEIHLDDFTHREEVGEDITHTHLHVNNLSKTFDDGNKAVDHVTFSMKKGEVTSLLGHNGAGKSTIFGMLAGQIQPSAGIIQKRSHNVGYCPQYNPLMSGLTVAEHLQLVCEIKSCENAEEEEERILSVLRLKEKKNMLATHLSGGEKRKLCLAMALIGGSEIVYLDEPTSEMDLESRADFIHVLKLEKRERAILLTTHYLEEAEVVSDKVILLFQGRILCSGSLDFVKQRKGKAIESPPLNSLEEVFHEVHHHLPHVNSSMHTRTENIEKFVELRRGFCKTGRALVSHQMLTLIYKKNVVWMKEYFKAFVHIGIPFLVFLKLLTISETHQEEFPMDDSMMGSGFFYANHTQDSSFASRLTAQLSENGYMINENVPDFEDLAYRRPAFMYRSLGGILVDNDTVKIFHNRLEPRTGSALINKISNLFGDVKIKASFLVVAHRYVPDNVLQLGLIFAVIMLVILFLSGTVDEQTTNFYFQQYLAGVFRVLYFVSNILADLLPFIVVIMCYCVTLFCFNRPVDRDYGRTPKFARRSINSIFMTFVVASGLFFCATLLVVVLSKKMKSAGKVAVVVICWMVIVPISVEIAFTALEIASNGLSFADGEQKSDTSLNRMINVTKTVYPFFFPSSAAYRGLESTVEKGDHRIFVEGKLSRLGLSLIEMLIFALICLSFCILYIAREAPYFKRREMFTENIEHDVELVEKRKTENLICAKEIRKCFSVDGEPSLKNVSLSIDKNECVGLVGLNGAGKSTLMNILAGFVIPSSGNVGIGGTTIGFCPQENMLLPNLTGRQTLMVLANIQGYDNAQNIVNVALEAVDMQDDADKNLELCSGGQRRKICFLMAVLGKKDLVLLDEPTSGIDTMGRSAVRQIISAISCNSPTSFLIASPVLDECSICSRIVNISDGEIFKE